MSSVAVELLDHLGAAVGRVVAAPSDAGRVRTVRPSEVTVMLGDESLASTVLMCAAPIDIDSVRLSSKASPLPALTSAQRRVRR